MITVFRSKFLLISITCLLVFGCSEREESGVAPGSTAAADEAVRKAEQRLEDAGVSFNLEEPGDLMNMEDLIPDPADLGDVLKRDNLEAAIEQFNTALAEIEQQNESGIVGSDSDRALVHVHLGFVYVFDAMSRLMISDDPEETFVIELDPDTYLYKFGISPEVQAKLDATENLSEYPLVFTVAERQAIIDAIDLIDDAIVKPKEPNIQPQFSSVDRQPYSGSAIWHFQKAANLFSQYDPDVMDSVEAINETLENLRALLQDYSEIWGFVYIPPVR